MIERRWPENVESDWAIDCSSPMSAKTSRKIGSREPAVGRDVQAGLVHQREQAERPQRDGLAAGVRAGDDERGVAVAEPDVDRDDAPGQARDGARRAGRPRARSAVSARIAVHARPASCALAAQKSNRASASSVSRSWLGVRGDERRQLVEDPLDLLLLGDLRLAPGVAELDGDERLDEQRLAAAGRVVDDALDPARASALTGTT